MKTFGLKYIDFSDISNNEWFDKQQFLFFDKIYYNLDFFDHYQDLSKSMGPKYYENIIYYREKLDKLEQLGFYEPFDLKKLQGNLNLLSKKEKQFYFKSIDMSLTVHKENLKYLKTTSDNDWITRYNKLDRFGRELVSQATSLIIQKSVENNCIPIIRSYRTQINDLFPEIKQSLLSVLIKSVPIISKDTSWEQLLEFKQDPDTKIKFIALKDFLNDLSKTDISEIEFKEKIEHNLNEYKNHMKYHKMKTDIGFFEILLTTTAETIEGIAKFNLSQITKNLFALSKRELALIEAENLAPNKEVAYIEKIHKDLL